MRSERNPVQILHLHLGLHTDLRGQVCFHGSLLGITYIPVEAITPPRLLHRPSKIRTYA